MLLGLLVASEFGEMLGEGRVGGWEPRIAAQGREKPGFAFRNQAIADEYPTHLNPRSGIERALRHSSQFFEAE